MTNNFCKYTVKHLKENKPSEEIVKVEKKKGCK